MILQKFEKQPRDRKDYRVSYVEWLENTDGDSIDNVDTEITNLTGGPVDLIVEAASTRDEVVLWIEGGSDGERYKIEINVDTVGGRRDQSELIFTVRDI